VPHPDGSHALAPATAALAPPTTATPFLGGRIARLGFLTLTGAFGLNFAAGQFFAPLTEGRGWNLSTLSAAAAVNAGDPAGDGPPRRSLRHTRCSAA
jgi:hypothetical protein